MARSVSHHPSLSVDGRVLFFSIPRAVHHVRDVQRQRRERGDPEKRPTSS